jgi:hypothetical protein
MKRVNWLLAIAFGIMLFLQPNKANAFNNNRTLDGTYRGRGTGTFWEGGLKFDFVSTELFTFDGAGNTSETLTFTYEGASSQTQGGPCTDTATGTYQVNQNGTGTSTYMIVTSSCGDTGGTYSFNFTTDGEYVYRILASDSKFAAFAIAGTSLRDRGFDQ